MKKLLLVTALLGIGAMSLPAHAATATGNFDVTINLTSACQVASSPTAHFEYTSFQTSASTFSSSFDIRCTNGLPITGIALDSTSVTDAATNLAYTLLLGTLPTQGTGANQSVPLTGSMPANQAGTCGGATCENTSSNNKQRTLTITY